MFYIEVLVMSNKKKYIEIINNDYKVWGLSEIKLSLFSRKSEVDEFLAINDNEFKKSKVCIKTL